MEINDLEPAQRLAIEEQIIGKLKQAKITKVQLLFQLRLFKYFVYGIIVLGVIIDVGGYILFNSGNGLEPLAIALFIIGGIIVVIGLIISTQQGKISHKLQDIFDKEFVASVANKIFANKYKNIKLQGVTDGGTNVNPVYEIFGYFKIKKNQPKYYESWNLNAMQGNVKYDFGSLLTSHVVRVRNNDVTIYEAWHYITFLTSESTELTTALFPEKRGLFGREKSKLSKEEIQEGLESTEFEKMFEIDYQNPVQLRRFFQPRIMANILDFVKEQSDDKKPPRIWINDHRVIVNFAFQRIFNLTDYSKILIHLPVGSTYKKTVEIIINKIINDVEYMIENMKWEKVLGIERYARKKALEDTNIK